MKQWQEKTNHVLGLIHKKRINQRLENDEFSNRRRELKRFKERPEVKAKSETQASIDRRKAKYRYHKAMSVLEPILMARIA